MKCQNILCQQQNVRSKIAKMTSFKSLNTKKYIKSRVEETIDNSYWKQLSQPVLIKEHSTVDYIDFSPIQPYNFAVTCSVRIQIYNPITKDVTKTLSRFQKTAYGGTFGKDGQLLVAGDDEGYIRLFETSTKRSLRSFEGHTAAVHRTHFTTDKLHIASFSDDKTVRLWDIANEECVQTFSEHNDYVRAGCVSPVSTDILLSGGYDHMVKMYDTRTNAVVFEVNHGNPVHSVLFLPTGGIFINAGGTHVNVWDAFAGGRLIATMSQHNRDVTCLRLASNGRRLMSGSLDRKVKIYDTATYRTVHTLDFPNGVTSLGISCNDETIVAGMVDGMVSIQRMDGERNIKTVEKRKIPTTIVATADEVVEDYERGPAARYDHFLRKYQYDKALDEVTKRYVMNKKPYVTVSLMSELIRRNGLRRALANRPDEFLRKFVTFLVRYLGDQRFIRVLIDVTNILLDEYEENFSKFTGDIGKQFMALSKALQREETLLLENMELHGALEMIFSGASVAEQSTETIQFERDVSELKPSSLAGQDFVVDLDE